MAKNIINFIRIIIILFSLLIADTYTEDEIYLDENILDKVSTISIKQLLKYESIADTISEQDDKSHFYLIIAIEIERRIKAMDNKFYSQQFFYIDKINEYEHVLNLPVHLLDTIHVDLGDIADISIQETVTSDYYQNKKRVQLASLIYIQKNTAYYRNPIEIYRNYFLALFQLYSSITLNDFRLGLESYYTAVNKI